MAPVTPVLEKDLSLNQDARLWSVYKDIYICVEAAIYKHQPEAIQDLHIILRKHKPDFLSLLKNPAKNAVNREEIKKAGRDGINVSGQTGRQTLTADFIDEVIIISDLFDLNEYATVELLLAGEHQLTHFPGLTRGLVAILLYYDGKRCLVNSLRTLMQARQGRTWTLELVTDLTNLVTKFTDELIVNGLPDKILALLCEFDLLVEINKLESQRGLGKAKHRKLVTDQIHEIRQSLAEAIFNLSSQSSLNKAHMLSLFTHLRDHSALNADGSLDNVSVCLLMAALYALDVSVIEQEDGEELVGKLPIMRDDDWSECVHRQLVTSDVPWVVPGVRATLQLAWAQSLRSLGQHAMTPGLADLCEQDELVADVAMEMGVFPFLKDVILTNDSFYNEEFYVRRLHGLITDFLVQMPLKVKELRNRGDEVARIIIAHVSQGLNPPTGLHRDFEHLLNLMAELYSKDPLCLELSRSFWCSTENLPSPGFSARPQSRPSQRQMSLYKFVRSAGDLLPPSLYVPYLTMLAGLANGVESAHHCYNLLKTNGTNYNAQASTVSFDHFFDSLNRYLNGLRQDLPAVGERVYRYSHHRGITPQELDGLLSVIRLVRVILSADENARVAMNDNQHWMVIYLLFGLLACSVPTVLKAELLLTLTAFAKTPEIANNLWLTLENSQILPTITTSSLSPSGGISAELDEVESRNEEFPMTLAFMQLIEVLLDSPAPSALGAGNRAPGVDPYVDFVRDSIFLKFTTRAYKNSAEKWNVACRALSIFQKLLIHYEPQPEDCLQAREDPACSVSHYVNPRPPGFTMMLHLLNDSRLLRMILFIVDDTIDHLDQYVAYEGRPQQTAAALHALRIIALVLERQQALLALIRESGSALIVTPMDKLLFAINPRTGKADHAVNIARYVYHGGAHPDHALAAVQILANICKATRTHSELVSMLTASDSLSAEILHGFVECLEVDDPEPEDDCHQTTEMEEGAASGSEVRDSCRLAIVRLLVEVCDHPAPNLAHYLLGFNTHKPISTASLQDPGVGGSPRTCLHSVLAVLATTRTTQNITPRLTEQGYQLIFKLCDNRDTSSVVMRYLRSSYDFFYTQLHSLQLPSGADKSCGHVTLQQAWLLRAVAIELRMTSLNKQRSHLQRLLTVLIDDQHNIRTPRGLLADQSLTGGLEGDHSLVPRPSVNMMTSGHQLRSKLMSLLEQLSGDEDDVMSELPHLELLNPVAVDHILALCEQTTQGRRHYGIRALHSILFRELSSLQGPSLANQRGPISVECKAVLELAVRRNVIGQRLWAKRCLFDSWRQCVEVVLGSSPLELLDGDSRQQFIFQLLQELLVKVSDTRWLPELTSSAASVLLTLLSNLRQCFLVDVRPQSDQIEAPSLAGVVSTGGQQMSLSSRTLYMSSLQVVVRGLIEFILRTSGSQQGIRANLYGALLYCLQIAQQPKQCPHINLGTDDDVTVPPSGHHGDSEHDKLRREYVSTISSYGEQLADVVARDACDGHQVVRMLALSSLDTILSLDRPSLSAWSAHLQSKGYLQHLVDDLAQDDAGLQAMLRPHPEPLRSLYLYESKLALLTRIASSASGAQALLLCGVMRRLAECAFLDMRPEPSLAQRHALNDHFVPSVMQRFRFLFFATLRLSLAIMTSLGGDNMDAANQVMKFIAAHSDVFHAILRNHQVRPDLRDLEELVLTTALLSRAAAQGPDAQALLDNMADLEMHSQLSRIHRQLLALLPRYSAPERYLERVTAPAVDGGDGSDGSANQRRHSADMRLAILTIVGNVLAYCRAVVNGVGTTSKHFPILFGPSLSHAINRDQLGLNDMTGGTSMTNNTGAVVSVAILVLYLRQNADLFISAVDAYKVTTHKHRFITELSTEELRQLSGVSAAAKLTTQQRQKLAGKLLQQIIEQHNHEIKRSFYVIEHCLFLLWRHLEFYFIHCCPDVDEATMMRIHKDKQSGMRRLQCLPSVAAESPQAADVMASWPTTGHWAADVKASWPTTGHWVTKDELDKLKLDSLSAINDTLLRKLSDIEQCYGRSHTHYGFMAALVRRLKRLLRLHTRVN